MIHLFKKSLLSISILCASFQAFGEVRVDGFANINVGKVNSGSGIFGFTDEIDFENNSLFALQVSSQVNDKVSATAQIIARGSAGYGADFEWAYLTYKHNSNNTFTAGRFRLPVFMYSASLDVGYSYHWITAPASVYDVAFNNINGLQYDYNNYSGDFEYVLQASVGNYEDEIAGGVNAGRDVVLLSAAGVYQNLKGRLVIGRGTNVFQSPVLDTQINGFVSAVEQAVGGPENIPPGINALADDLRIDDDEGTFVGIGFNYDNFKWFVGGEWTQVVLEESFTPDDTAYYLTSGFRVGKWTPHITLQARDGAGDIKFTDRVASLPADFIPGATALNTGLQSFFFEDYSMLTIGARYDIAAGIALKGEISYYDNKVENLLDPSDSGDTTIVNLSLNYIF